MCLRKQSLNRLIFAILIVAFATVSFLGNAFAQGTASHLDIYKRWAFATKYVGTFSWTLTGSRSDDRFSATWSEKVSGTVTLQCDPLLSACGPVRVEFTRFEARRIPGLNPFGSISATAEIKGILRDTGCGRPGQVATETHDYILSDGEFFPIGFSFDLTLLAPNALGNPRPGVAVYGVTAAVSAKEHIESTDCDGQTTSRDIPAIFQFFGLTFDVGGTARYFDLPSLGQTLSGSQPFTRVSQTDGTVAIVNGTFSWNLVADPSHDIDCATEASGNSTIECENQILREDVPIVGTPLTLTYSSDRVPGRTKGNQVAQAHTASLGGWNFSSQHRYDKDAVCILLGGGGRLSSVILGSITPSASGDYQIASSDGREVYVFAGTDGRHLKTRDTLTGADLLTYGYDSAQRLINITDVNGNVTKIERDAAGRMTAVVSPFNQRTTFTNDANGYIASVTNPNGEVSRMTYTAGGLMTSMTNPRGVKTTFSYDAEGRLLRDDNAVGGFLKLSKVSNPDQSFDVTLSTALGRTTKYHTLPFATGGEKRTITSPANLVSTIERDGSNNTNAKAPDGMKTIQQLGDDPRFGRAAGFVRNSSITSPAGLKLATIGNRSVSLATTATDPFSLTSLIDTTAVNGRTYTSKYDAATKTFTDTTPQGRQSKVTIDAKGRAVSQQTAGLFPVEYTYDARGRVATVTAGVGTTLRTTTFTYDASSYLNSIADPIGRRVSFTRDAVGRVKQQTLPDGRTIAFAYDQNGNLTGLTPPGRPEHKFTYDQLDLTTEYLPPPARLPTSKTTYSYNLDRDPTSIGHPDGKNIAMAYDSAGRVSDITLSRGGIRFAYDQASGNLVTVDSPDGVRLKYEYDGSLATSETWSGAVAGTLKRKFDNNFRVVETQVNDEAPITSSYDLDGLLTKVGDLTLSRNPQNGLLTGGKLGVVSDSWTYNGFGEPLSYRASATGATLYDVQFNRDALGRIATKIETVAGVRTIFAYAYDLAGRLSQVKRNGIVTSTYTYDSNGNRLSHITPSSTVSGTNDDQDRLLSYGNTTYTYSANGELKTKKVGNQITSYDYDELGNLIGVTLPDGKKVTYVIDGASRRVGKKINGVLVQGLLYDGGLRPVAELDGAGRVVSRFIYSGHSNFPSYITQSGKNYRLVTDGLGSPKLVVEVASGSVLQRTTYDEFGNALNVPNSRIHPFGFGGGLVDNDTGLIRFGARDYDPTIGRWTTKDPLEFDGDETNFYSFASNNPIGFVDLDGLESGVLPGSNIPYRIDWRQQPAPNMHVYWKDGTETVINDKGGWLPTHGGRPTAKPPMRYRENLRQVARRFVKKASMMVRCLAIVPGLIEDLRLLRRAGENNRSFGEQLEMELKNAGPTLNTDWGPIPNPYHTPTTLDMML